MGGGRTVVVVAGVNLERLLLAENVNLDTAPWAREDGDGVVAPVVGAVLLAVHEVGVVYREG